VSTRGNKLIRELKAVFWVPLYFLSWFGILVLIKHLLLEEYQIDPGSYVVVIVGALIVAKVVLILENVKLSFLHSSPAYLEVLVRTLLYMAGVVVVMFLERSFEARHDYGGMTDAMMNLTSHVNMYHFMVSVICVFLALLFFNLWSVLKGHLGTNGVKRMFLDPVNRGS